MDCCSIRHIATVRSCFVNKCLPRTTSIRQVKFIIQTQHRDIYVFETGENVVDRTWHVPDIHSIGFLHICAFKTLRQTNSTLSNVDVICPCCVNQISAEIHQLLKDERQSFTICINVVVDHIVCERCLRRAIIEWTEVDPVIVPASMSYVESLMKTSKPSSVQAGAEYDSCVICLDEFQEGDSTIQLPCCHVFHCNCIEKWLQHSHCCPLCRYELPAESG